MEESFFRSIPTGKGWVPKQTKSGQVRVTLQKGWEPTVGAGQDVGVGADGDDWGTDPLSWLGGKANRIKQDWEQGQYLQALGRSAFLPFEATNKAIGWGVGGPVMGGAQMLRQQLEGTSGSQGWGVDTPIVSGQLPATGGLEDIFDWQKAGQRWETVNPWARFAVELAAMKVPAKVLSPIDAALQAAAARRNLTKGGDALGLLGSIARVEPPKGLEKLTTSPTGQALIGTANVASRIALPVGGAALGWGAFEDEDKPFENRLMGAAGGLLVGGTSAWVISTLGKKVIGKAVSGRPDQFPVDVANMSPELQATLGNYNKAKAIGEGYSLESMGGVVSPIGTRTHIPPYPGGQGAWSRDIFKAQALDSASFIQRWRPRVEELVYRSMNRGLLPEEDAYLQFRLMSGVGRSVEAQQAPIIAEYNTFLRNRGEKNQLYETWLYLQEAVNRAGRGHTTGDIRNGAQAQARLDEMNSWLRTNFNPHGVAVGSADDIVTRFDTAARNVTAHFDQQLDRMVQANVLTADEVNKMKADHDIYTFMKDVEFFKPRIDGDEGWFGEQSKFGKTMLARTKGIETETSGATLANTNIVDTLNNFAFREALLNKNKLGTALVEWRKRDPDGFGRFMIHHPEGARMPKGWEKIPVFEKEINEAGIKTIAVREGLITINPITGRLLDPTGRVVKVEDIRAQAEALATAADRLGFEVVAKNLYRVPKEFHDSLMGFSVESADLTSRIAGKFTNILKAGVTAFSIPFIFRNPTRDVETAMLNMGINSLSWQSWTSAFIDVLTGGRAAELFGKAATSPVLGKWDLWGRMKDAMLVPGSVTTATPKGERWVNEMFKARGGMGTFAEQLRPGETSLQKLGLEGAIPVGANPLEWVRRWAETMELATRVGVYRTARVAGRVPEQAALMARESTVDFSRGGNSLRVLNLMVPLLNARVQGTYRMAEAARNDPYGFMLRGIVMAGIPTIATYIHNRENFSDLYDMIPPEIKDRYHTVITGSYTDRLGGQRPIYFTIPKDSWQQLIATPLEYFMDNLFHASAQGEPLDLDRRTERDLAKMIYSEIANQLPVDVGPDALTDPIMLGGALLQAQPMLGIPAQLMANQDWRRGKVPIVDPYDEYLSPDWPDTVSGPLVNLLSEKLGLLPGWHPAPSQIAFMAKTLGGTMAQTFMGAGDILAERLGVQPTAPTDWNQLRVPPDTDPRQYERINKMVANQDLRPPIVKLAPFLLSASGGAQTQIAKVRQLDKKSQQIYWDTQNRDSHYQSYKHNTAPGEGYMGDIRLIEQNIYRNLTHGEATAAIFRAGYKLSGVYAEGSQIFPTSITDPDERQKFVNSLPGVPLNLDKKKTYLKPLTDNQLRRATLVWDSPPAINANKELMSNPTTLDAARNQEISKLSKEWGMDSGDIRDQIMAQKMGNNLPSLTIPALYLEEALNEYRFPSDFDPKVDSPDKLPLMRAAAMRRLATRWGVNPDQLWDRVRARMSYPEEMTPMMTSWEKAMSLASEANDPVRRPQYMDAYGNKAGDPERWKAWDIAIEESKSRYGSDRSKWPTYIRQIDDMKRYADAARLTFLMQDQDYEDYQKWFGIGNEMTEATWDAYMSGRAPRYKVPGSTVENWNKWDSTISLYEALPASSPTRKALAPIVKKLRKVLDPGWRRNLMKEEMEWEEETGQAAEMASLYREALGG